MGEPTRQQELESMSSEQLQEIASGYGIGVPASNKWSDAIGKILEYEGIREVIPSRIVDVPFTPELPSPGLQQAPATKNIKNRKPKTGSDTPVYSVETVDVDVNNDSTASGEKATGGEWLFAKDVYAELKFSFCPKCGEKRRTTLTGKRVCAINAKECPMLPKEL